MGEKIDVRTEKIKKAGSSHKDSRRWLKALRLSNSYQSVVRLSGDSGKGRTCESCRG